MTAFAKPESNWRRTIDDGEHRARAIGRIIVGLMIAIGVLSVTTYHGYAAHAAVCRAVSTLDAGKFHYLGEAPVTGIRDAQEVCR